MSEEEVQFVSFALTKSRSQREDVEEGLFELRQGSRDCSRVEEEERTGASTLDSVDGVCCAYKEGVLVVATGSLVV